jgi:methionyl-tRNA formyltransferase
MRIDILCPDAHHPVMGHLERWVGRQADALICHELATLRGGDFLFLISCGLIITPCVRDRYRHNLVIHASDLPQGRGWSPHVWTVVQGGNVITVALLDVAEQIDRGAIWFKRHIHLEGHELYDEINNLLFDAELDLMDFAIAHASNPPRQQQDEAAASYFPRRRPEDSRLDPEQSLASQFNLLRICDPDRYPAFFELRGHRYEVRIRKTETPDEVLS